MPEEHDELRIALRQLSIPMADTNAVGRIMASARQNPRRVWKWLGALRQFRALLYIPRMRYVIMASGVAFFIVIGLVTPHSLPSPKLTDEALLLDVDFDEEADWADNFWLDPPDSAHM